MYIGFYDHDLISDRKNYTPNLAMMRLAYYLKKNRNVVELMLNEIDWERYEKIYVFKDNSNTQLPKDFISQARHKIEFVGKKFYGGKYVPFQKEVECCLPDRTIYDKAFKKFSMTAEFKTLLNKNQVRLQTDKQFTLDAHEVKGVYVHDENPRQYHNFYKLLTLDKKIEFKYPIIVETLTEAFNILSYGALMNRSAIKVLGYPKKEEIEQLLQLPLHSDVYIRFFEEKYDDVNNDTAFALINMKYKDFLELALKPHLLYLPTFEVAQPANAFMRVFISSKLSSFNKIIDPQLYKKYQNMYPVMFRFLNNFIRGEKKQCQGQKLKKE